MSAKVCVMTVVHRATDTRIYRREAITLAHAGYSVSLIAPQRNDLPIERDIEFVPIRMIRRRGLRFLRSACSIVRLAKKQAADVYHIHDPELLLAGFRLAHAGCRVIYDAHENLPAQILGKLWIPSLLRRPLSWMADHAERRLSRSFSTVVAATPSIAERFAHAVVVHNYPDLNAFPRRGANPGFETKGSAFFVGGISRTRGADTMVRAMGRLPAGMNVMLYLIGGMQPESLRAELQAIPGAERVCFLGARPWNQAWQHVIDSDGIGLLLYHPYPNHIEALPTKMFEYMAAGVPVIASDFPLWRRIITTHECGLVVDPTDPQQIAGAIASLHADETLRHQMGQNGRRAAEESYNWKAESARLLVLYERILS